MQCFQKDPNLRVSARKLLKHPWIMNAKRSDVAPSEQPTQYESAVKSVQQWNEALKSPDQDSIRRSRPTSLSPHPSKNELLGARAPAPSQPKPLVLASGLLGNKPSTDAFRSPEIEDDTNWDADFASAISPSALHLPHLRPHDNFKGLFSADNLKAFANFEAVTEENHANGRSTELDSMDTVKPYTPQKSRMEPKASMPNTSSQRLQANSKNLPGHQRNGSKVSGSNGRPKSGHRIRPSADFREDPVDDYSDLLDATEDDAFQRKLQELKIKESKSFAPKLFHPSDLQITPKQSNYSRKSTSLRRFPSGESRQGLARTRSSVEIQKYAEDDNEDPESFLEKDLVLRVHGSDSGSEHGTLMMSNSKLSNNSIDDEEEYDPFAQLEEEFDQMDYEANFARDRFARQSTHVEGLVASLTKDQPNDVLDNITEELVS